MTDGVALADLPRQRTFWLAAVLEVALFTLNLAKMGYIHGQPLWIFQAV